LRSLAYVAAIVVLTGCVLTPAPTASSPSPSPEGANGSTANVSQDLSFTGKLPLRWTTADVSCGQADGKGTDSFSVKLTGPDPQNQKDTLTVVVPSGYTGAGDYSLQTTAALSVAATGGALIASSSPVLQTQFIVGADLKSGTIDANLAEGANQQDAVEHVQGTWRCK
jgi:hypothetical protein